MVKIEHHQGKFAPLCICDVCGQRITDALNAIALYPDDRDKGQSERVPVIHVHKGECDRRATASYGDDGGTDELSTHFIWLLSNMGLRGDKLKNQIDQIEQFGM